MQVNMEFVIVWIYKSAWIFKSVWIFKSAWILYGFENQLWIMDWIWNCDSG